MYILKITISHDSDMGFDYASLSLVTAELLGLSIASWLFVGLAGPSIPLSLIFVRLS